MTRDRDHYRGMPTKELYEEVHYGTSVDWKELALAMSERLEDCYRTLEDIGEEY